MSLRITIGGAALVFAALGSQGAAAGEAAGDKETSNAPSWTLGAHAFADWTGAEVETGASPEDREITLLRFDATRKYRSTTLVLEADISQNEFTVHDAFLDVPLGDHGPTLRLGHFKEPNSLEQVSMLYGKTFVRSPGLVKVNGVDRRLGVGLRGYLNEFTFEGALFASNVNEEDQNDGWSASARAAYGVALGGRDDSYLHLGVSTRYRDTGDARLSYGQDAYSFATGKTIKTSAIGDSDVFLGLEAAYQAGSFSTQGEASRTFVDCAPVYCAGSSATFDAAYVDASYVFGGQRSYNPHGGKFGRYKIDNPLGGDGGMGAFELAMRYDYADLIDTGVAGGRQTTGILGATYHANQNLRFQLNYADSDIKAPTTGLSRDVEAVTFRMQLDLTTSH
jgi:phosphate-selective porin OprO and OprP